MKLIAILSIVFCSAALLVVAVTPTVINPEVVTLAEPYSQPIGPLRIRGDHITLDYRGTAGLYSVLCGEVFRFQWFGEANKEYQVETSPNMKTWIATGVIIEGQNAVETWYEPTGPGRRFFRLTVVSL